MAHILLLTQVLPYPLDAGPKVRAYYVLRHLTQRHEVTLVSFVREDDQPTHVAHLRSFCHAVHTVHIQRSRLRDVRAVAVAGLTRKPVIIVRDEIKAMHTLLRQLVSANAFDVIHADQTSMAQYALYAKRLHVQTFQRGNVKTILDVHNALYRVFEQLARGEPGPLQRQFLRRESRALARYEAQTYPRFDHVVFVTGEDRRAIELQMANGKWQMANGEWQMANGKSQMANGEWQVASGKSQIAMRNSTLIPICVDPQAKPLLPLCLSPHTITHLGTMFWPPNVEGVLWFARKVFPRVLDKMPDARFVIIGKRPPQEIQALPSQVRNIHVTGYVPDPQPYLAETGVFIVPLHAGAGMRVKILDAWCWGIPIVSTTLGIEGIAAEDGKHVLIADRSESFARAVVRLLTEADLRARLQESGRSWVEERYDWRKIYAQWDEVYENL